MSAVHWRGFDAQAVGLMPDFGRPPMLVPDYEPKPNSIRKHPLWLLLLVVTGARWVSLTTAALAGVVCAMAAASTIIAIPPTGGLLVVAAYLVLQGTLGETEAPHFVRQVSRLSGAALILSLISFNELRLTSAPLPAIRGNLPGLCAMALDMLSMRGDEICHAFLATALMPADLACVVLVCILVLERALNLYIRPRLKGQTGVDA